MLPKSQVFKSAHKLITGINASTSLLTYCQQLNMNNVFLLTDNGVLKSGSLEPIIQLLENNQITYTIYSDITPEPEIDVVLKCKQIFQKNQYNGVIAVGGGSVIDTAKCIAVFGNSELPLEEFFGENKITQKGLPFRTYAKSTDFAKE